jgi:photosystem II stability/assembly factor-like uncharacterized protein
MNARLRTVIPALLRTVIPAKAGIQFCLVALACVGFVNAQDAPAPNAKDLKPRPAEIAPLAAKNLLLAITQAGERLVAVGDRGTILLSGDGAKWDQVASPVHATLTAVSFADPQNGWAVGHDASILHTTDGGARWTLQHFKPEDNKPLLGVLALDAQRAYAVGAYGLFLETADAGEHWSPVDAPAILEEGLHLNTLIRLGDGALFMAGETGLLGVSAGAAGWKRLNLPYEGSLFGALPRGDKGVMVFGLRGNVLVSDDVHTNQWRKVDTQTTQSMFGGVYLADGTTALVGADGEILLIDPAGAVRKARGPKDERSLGSGTLSGVWPWQDGLLMVGEVGVSRLKLR